VPRLLIGNLDAEARWAGVALPLRVRRAISALATLMAGLADDGDALWTPEPVAPERVPAIPGVPRLALRSGPVRETVDALWWCNTDATARAVNHRGFALALAMRRGYAHAGAAMVGSLAELDAHLATWRPTGTWVLKAPLSASGRDRLRYRGTPLAGEHRTYAERLLARGEPCLVEPWVDRLSDFGVTERGTHQLEVDPAGVFRGITLGERVEEPALEAAYAAVRAALADAGYDGRAGIDAYRWRDELGHERLQPLSEINARHTFAHVAHALANRVRAALQLGPGPSSLRIAAGSATATPGPGVRAIPLLEPGADEATRAWLELGEPLGPAQG
jgi:hypothetical protein